MKIYKSCKEAACDEFNHYGPIYTPICFICDFIMCARSGNDYLWPVCTFFETLGRDLLSETGYFMPIGAFSIWAKRGTLSLHTLHSPTWVLLVASDIYRGWNFTRGANFCYFVSGHIATRHAPLTRIWPNHEGSITDAAHHCACTTRSGNFSISCLLKNTVTVWKS